MRPMPMGTPGPMPMGTPGPMPMGTPGPMPMTPQRGAQPPLGPGGTPVGKAIEILQEVCHRITVCLHSQPWVDCENLSAVSQICQSGYGRSTKSKATGIQSKISCLWLSSFRYQSVSLSHVALPTEPVPLSAPGGPPERSALSASVLQGAVPRTPCSPIPGVGKLKQL